MSTTSRLNFQTAQESDTPSPQTTNVNDGRPAFGVLGGLLDSRAHSDSDTALANLVAQDGPGITSGVLGGIANALALGMRPPTAKEAKLEKDNHRLKEENKVLREEYYNVQMAARKYHHDAFRFHHENQRLTETLEAMSLEIKGVTKRYEEAKSLAETRLKRVLAAQVFVTSEADSQSISDLIHKVESLKDEIEISNSADSDAEAKMQDGADPLPTILTSTTSSSRSKGSHNNKPDPDTTPFASDGCNDENATTTTSETRTNAIPGADQGGDLRNTSDSEATLIKPAAQGTSDVLSGIANTLGMSPPTAKEAKLEKDNHRLKEENKVLRTEYYNVQMAARTSVNWGNSYLAIRAPEMHYERSSAL